MICKKYNSPSLTTIIINIITSRGGPYLRYTRFSFLFVPHQLIPVPDLKLMEILFHYFDPFSSWSSSWSFLGDTSYQHLFCYPLFWKSLYLSQPAQSLCRYWGLAVHLCSVRCWSSSSTDPLPSFHRISSWPLDCIVSKITKKFIKTRLLFLTTVK